MKIKFLASLTIQDYQTNFRPMVCAQMKIWAFGEAAQQKLIQLGGPALPSFILIPSLRSSLHGKKMGKQWKQWLTLFGGGSKITADGDCSHEIKRRLLLGREVMTNLDSILKSRAVTLPTKVRLVKAIVFPVFTYGCESWTIKKAER